MKMDRNEKVQSIQLFSTVITDLIRYHLMIKENSHEMESFMGKLNPKINRDSLLSIWDEYKKDKRKFRSNVVGNETLSEKFFNGFVHCDFADGQYSIIELIKRYLLDISRIFYIVHPKTHVKYYFSCSDVVQNFLDKNFKIINGAKLSKIAEVFVFEYFFNRYQSLLLKHNMINDAGELKKHYKKIFDSLIERYINHGYVTQERTKPISLHLINTNEEIEALIDNRYLTKNIPLCRTLSEMLNLNNKITLSFNICIHNKSTHEKFQSENGYSLAQVLKESVNDIYKHLSMPPIIYKSENTATGASTVILPIYYNKSSKLTVADKGIISKYINRVIRHITLPVSFREEIIVPEMQDNGEIIFKLLELGNNEDIEEHIFINNKFLKLLKDDSLSKEDKTYISSVMMLMKGFIENLEMKSIPDRNVLLFLLSVINHNNIYYKIKDRLIELYKEAFSIINPSCNLEDPKQFNAMSSTITLKNRVKGRRVELDKVEFYEEKTIESENVEENENTKIEEFEEEVHSESEAPGASEETSESEESMSETEEPKEDDDSEDIDTNDESLTKKPCFLVRLLRILFGK